MSESLCILFIIASLVIIVTPGQDMMLVMSKSIAGGPWAGVATAAGVSTGLLGHTLLASLGLGALLCSSMLLFTAIKIAGGIYLVHLGWRMFKNARARLHMSGGPAASPGRLFAQGMLSNISNPKITIFYFAYLPQFLAADSANHAQQLFLLGTAFAFLTLLIKAPVGYCAGRLSSWLLQRPLVLSTVNRTNGIILVGLGLRLALASRE